MRLKDHGFRKTLDQGLNAHFPKNKCKERSSALMLFAIALLEHENIVEHVKLHMNHLLAVADDKESQAYREAKEFYLKLE